MQITFDVTEAQAAFIFDILFPGHQPEEPGDFRLIGKTAGERAKKSDDTPPLEPQQVPGPTPEPTVHEAPPLGIDAIRKAVLEAADRMTASGTKNTKAHVVNKLDEVCGCTTVGAIPVDQYEVVIQALATLGV